jgi:hypothetical protein
LYVTYRLNNQLVWYSGIGRPSRAFARMRAAIVMAIGPIDSSLSSTGW